MFALRLKNFAFEFAHFSIDKHVVVARLPFYILANTFWGHTGICADTCKENNVFVVEKRRGKYECKMKEGTCDKCSVSSNSTFEGIWQLLSHKHRSLYSIYHEMLDGVQAHEVWHAESEAQHPISASEKCRTEGRGAVPFHHKMFNI